MQVANKKTAIYQHILELLLSRRYAFGQKILVKEIGEETGVSRQPIMTALNSLQERGFVVITAQVGCEVVHPTHSDVEDFYEMFANNEALIAGLAADRGLPEEALRMAEINDKIRNINPQHSDASESYRTLNVEFHRMLHSMARSPILSARQIANFELSDFFIVQTCGFQSHLGAATDEHDEIVTALRTRNKKAAAKAAAAHIHSIAKDVVAKMSSDAELAL
ncbi:GntR family transcriptional regulator [Pseudomonas huaxiensis]|uniref:GntR family transcriptional regulator n=1 Tax=Pseudomonas huaxiensis TaxID=2213017 RepID=UPI000DA6A241|nr:GntR family transcriptional regulator [Pseudomonas huaxiensis]